MLARRVLVGEFGRAQGVRGEVRLVSHTADPLAITRYGPFESEDGERRFEIVSLRPHGATLVARVKGVEDRASAEALTRQRLYAPRERLPDRERAEGEYFIADLIGLAAVSETGATLGQVVAAPNFGAGDILEIAPTGGGATFLLPFAAPFVGEVDIAAGQVVVRPPADEVEVGR